jgi:hypothetical protein
VVWDINKTTLFVIKYFYGRAMEDGRLRIKGGDACNKRVTKTGRSFVTQPCDQFPTLNRRMFFITSVSMRRE